MSFCSSISDNSENASSDMQSTTSMDLVNGGSSKIARSLLQPDKLSDFKLTNLLMPMGRLTNMLSDKSRFVNVDTQSRPVNKTMSDNKLHPSKAKCLRLGSANEPQQSCEMIEFRGSATGSDSALDETSEFALLGSVTSFGQWLSSR